MQYILKGNCTISLELHVAFCWGGGQGAATGTAVKKCSAYFPGNLGGELAKPLSPLPCSRAAAALWCHVLCCSSASCCKAQRGGGGGDGSDRGWVHQEFRLQRGGLHLHGTSDVIGIDSAGRRTGCGQKDHRKLKPGQGEKTILHLSPPLS